MSHSVNSILASLGVTDGTAAGEPTRGATPAPAPVFAPGPVAPTFASEEAGTAAAPAAAPAASPSEPPNLDLGAWDDILAEDPPVEISQPAPVTDPPPAPVDVVGQAEDTTGKRGKGRPPGARNKQRPPHPNNLPQDGDEGPQDTAQPAAVVSGVTINVQLDQAFSDRLEALEQAVQGIGEGLAALAKSLCDGMATSRAEAVASLEAAKAATDSLHTHLNTLPSAEEIASLVLTKVAAARRSAG